jgi:hypothetical protein
MAWPSKDYKRFLVHTDRHLITPRYKRPAPDEGSDNNAAGQDFRNYVERTAEDPPPPRGKHINPSSRLSRVTSKRPKYRGPNA